MSLITSNIQAVRRRLGTLQRNLPFLVRQGIASVPLQVYRELAEEALEAVAKPEEKEFIPLFVEAVTGQGTRHGVQVKLVPPKVGGEVQQARKAQLTGQTQYERKLSGEVPTDELADAVRAQQAQDRDLIDQVRDAVRDWVAIEKDLSRSPHSEAKSETDVGMMDTVVDNIMWILGVHEESKRSNYTPTMRAAADSLMPHIQEFMVRARRARGFGPGMVQRWLLAVLARWIADARGRIPMAVKKTIEESWSRMVAGRIAGGGG